MARAVRLVWSDPDTAIADGEIIDHRTENDWYANIGYAPVVADVAFFEEADHTGSRAQCHRSATHEQDAVNPVYGADGL